jgi:threonine/homoserine/homoserine lactone efflux protein
LLSFTAVALVLIVVPGPSVLFVIGRALAYGRRAALASVLGNATGVFVQATAVAFGIGAVIAGSIAVFDPSSCSGPPASSTSGSRRLGSCPPCRRRSAA